MSGRSFLIAALAVAGLARGAEPPRTQLVLLGTGSPPADPDRSGPASAIVVNGAAYLVDFGAGVVRRVPLEVYGPHGTEHMTKHVLEAWREDGEARGKHYAEGFYTVGSFPEGRKVNAHDIKPGVVYQDANVKVTAFATPHAMESLGYRFDTADRSIVISGDTNPSQATIDACNGCDVLVHEVLTHDWLSRRPDFHAYASRWHTTTTQLAELATKAKPKLLVLYHASISWRPVVDSQRSRPEVLLGEMMSKYSGQFVVGRDLDVY